MPYYLKQTEQEVDVSNTWGHDVIIPRAIFHGPFPTTTVAGDYLLAHTGGQPDLSEWELWDVDEDFPTPDRKMRAK